MAFSTQADQIWIQKETLCLPVPVQLHQSNMLLSFSTCYQYRSFTKAKAQKGHLIQLDMRYKSILIAALLFSVYNARAQA